MKALNKCLSRLKIGHFLDLPFLTEMTLDTGFEKYKNFDFEHNKLRILVYLVLIWGSSAIAISNGMTLDLMGIGFGKTFAEKHNFD